MALLPGLLWAQDQRFAFALPDLEGRINLGVFDSAGKLVRTLYVSAEESDFQIGLNGLIASWDGKNDLGEAVPPGRYRVRGYVVGREVAAEGLAYHFNDWIGDDDSPEISGVEALEPGTGEDLLLFGSHPVRDAGGSEGAGLWTFGAELGLQTRVMLPSGSRFLAGDTKYAVIADGASDRVLLYDLDRPGEAVASEAAETAVESGTLRDGRFYFVPARMENGIGQRRVPDLKPEPDEPAPVRFAGLAANEAALLGWNAEGVWFQKNRGFSRVPVPEWPKEFSLSAGPEETFWVAGGEMPDFVVRQHGFDGELLREMKWREEGAGTFRVFASRSELEFYLMIRSSDGAKQTVRGFRPATGGPPPGPDGVPQVDWEIFFEKTIEASRRFGFVDGRLVADAGDVPQQHEETVALDGGDLQSGPASLTIKATCDHAGIWLRSAEGLPLLFLAPRFFADRLILRGEKNGRSLGVFAGDGVVVAEYRVSGLNRIAALDAGELEIP